MGRLVPRVAEFRDAFAKLTAGILCTTERYEHKENWHGKKYLVIEHLLVVFMGAISLTLPA